MSRKANPEARMSFAEHLVELRKRIVAIAIGLVIAAILGWFVAPWIFEQLYNPVQLASEATRRQIQLNFIHPIGGIQTRINITLFIAIIASAPWWIYQLWAYITPGLTKSERRYTLGFLFSSTPFFLGGATLGWILLPRAIEVMVKFFFEDVVGYFNTELYVSFVLKFVLALGISGLFPVLMVFLTLAGIVQAKTWGRHWRIIVVLCLVFGAIMSPTPEVVLMLIIGVPLIVLYLLALVVCLYIDKRKAKRLEQL